MSGQIEVPTRDRLDRIEERLGEQAGMLREIGDGIVRIIEILSPEVSEGPTLDEILAQLVAQIGDQGRTLGRIDARTHRIEIVVTPRKTNGHAGATEPIEVDEAGPRPAG